METTTMETTTANYRLRWAILILIFAITAWLTTASGLPYFNSDPQGESVVAISLIKNGGSPTLSGKYLKYFRPKGQANYRISQNGQYAYPIGTPLFISPIAFGSKLVGINPLRGQGDKKIQTAVVALIIFFTSLITYQIANQFFGIGTSVLFSILTIFGTLVGPTVGGALWSIDLDILLTGLVVLRIIRGRYGKLWDDCMLGILLFCGYLVRPGFSLFIAGTFVILYLLDRKSFIVTAITAAILFFSFVGWSFMNYHSYLPPYYEQFAKLSFHSAGTAFLGLLFSPSKSILIFSPITLSLIVAPFLIKNESEKFRILVISYLFVCLAWFLLNVFWPIWWGGASYGPRILTNLSYLSALVAIILAGLVRPRGKWMLAFCFVLFFAGVPIALQGMYNPASVAWNGVPTSNGSLQNRTVWVWRYPQWSITSRSLYQMCVAEGKRFHVRCDLPP